MTSQKTVGELGHTTSTSSNMAEHSKRSLHHGPLRAPIQPATQTSYTEPTRTPGDLLIQKKAKSQSRKGTHHIAVGFSPFPGPSTDMGMKVITFSSQKTPQPFLDPAIMNAKVARERTQMSATKSK